MDFLDFSVKSKVKAWATVKSCFTCIHYKDRRLDGFTGEICRKHDNLFTKPYGCCESYEEN